MADANRAAAALARVSETVRTMVQPGGCAWHAVQTHASLTPFLIEETAEFIESIEQEAPAADAAAELGDVLYQVLFHTAIAERDAEGYDLASVADALSEKLIARHPHVFGDRGSLTVEELHQEWERLKEDAAGEERGSRGVLEGIPRGMPTLARTAKVIERLKRAGLLEPVSDRPRSEAEIGNELLATLLEANASGVDADRALRLATGRLIAEHGVDATE